MKRWFGALALLLALAACGGGAEQATEAVAEPTPTLAADNPAGGERPTDQPADDETAEPATDQPATDQAGPTDEPATAKPATERPTVDPDSTQPTVSSERTAGLRQIGEEIAIDGVVYAVTDFERTEKPDQLHTAGDGEIFYAVTLKIENRENPKAVAFNPLFTSVSDNDGYNYGPDVLVLEGALGSGKLEAGKQTEGKIIFRGAKDATGLAFNYTPLTIGTDQTFSVALDGEAGAAPPALAGERAEGEGLALTLVGIEPRETLLPPADGEEFIALDLAVDNLALDSLSVNQLNFALVGSDGAERMPELSAGFRSLQAVFIGKGARNRGYLAFGVPKGETEFTLVFDPGRGRPEVRLAVKR